MSEWMRYRGTSVPDEAVCRLPLPPAPPWRSFGPRTDRPEPDWPAPKDGTGGHAYIADEDVAERVTAAMYLRRPLLVTGKPGVGKSTLAFSVARELRLGPVLHWPINSRSTLQDGLYRYDALGRLQEARLEELKRGSSGGTPPESAIGKYLQLGPLGTALLPSSRPRVLLIDEFDKSDIDLPNDLLDVFESGTFEVPELSRMAKDKPTVEVMTADYERSETIKHGRVRCHEFPIVILTSNGEREFPAAFKRRCLRLPMEPPEGPKLEEIIRAHIGADAVDACLDIVEGFHERVTSGDLATDQLLNAIYLSFSGLIPEQWTLADLAEALMPPLGPQ